MCFLLVFMTKPFPFEMSAGSMGVSMLDSVLTKRGFSESNCSQGNGPDLTSLMKICSFV